VSGGRLAVVKDDEGNWRPSLAEIRNAEVFGLPCRAVGFEQYQQLACVRRPQCRSAAIAGDGRLDALADPRLASKRLADPQRDH